MKYLRRGRGERREGNGREEGRRGQRRRRVRERVKGQRIKGNGSITQRASCSMISYMFIHVVHTLQ